MKTPKVDPMVRAMRKSYRSSQVCALDELFIELRKWSRRETIARNKLEIVRAKINALAEASVKAANTRGEGAP